METKTLVLDTKRNTDLDETSIYLYSMLYHLHAEHLPQMKFDFHNMQDDEIITAHIRTVCARQSCQH